jgi:hypothetical protein
MYVKIDDKTFKEIREDFKNIINTCLTPMEMQIACVTYTLLTNKILASELRERIQKSSDKPNVTFI